MSVHYSQGGSARAADSGGAAVVRPVEAMADFRRIEDLQSEIWGYHDRELVPACILIAGREAGGSVLGAFDGGEMVGFALAFPSRSNGVEGLHSDMVGVRAAYRRQGIGLQLKVCQREEALRQGLSLITWTFDPLRAVNAYFNLRRLGATSRDYKTDFYGPETSSGLGLGGTDRLWVRWEVGSVRVRRCLDSPPAGGARAASVERVPALLTCGTDGAPRADAAAVLEGNSYLRVEIPRSVEPGQAREWRLATREAFKAAMPAGYEAIDFCFAEPERGAYVLARRPAGEQSGWTS